MSNSCVQGEDCKAPGEPQAKETAIRFYSSRPVSTAGDEKAVSANFAVHTPGISPDQMISGYTHWARRGSYESDLSPGRYNGPKYAADAVYRHADVTGVTPRILDVAAGTGLLGDELIKRGFSRIDALDPAEGMLEVAKAKGIYQNYIQEYLGGDRSSLLEDTYDVLVTSGGMGEGHIPCSSLKEMVRIAKPNGIVVIVMRTDYLETVADYRGRLEPYMRRLEAAGAWKQVEATCIPCYSYNNKGKVYVFTVLCTGTKDVPVDSKQSIN